VRRLPGLIVSNATTRESALYPSNGSQVGVLRRQIELTRRLRAVGATMPIMLLTTFDDAAVLLRAAAAERRTLPCSKVPAIRITGLQVSIHRLVDLPARVVNYSLSWFPQG